VAKTTKSYNFFIGELNAIMTSQISIKQKKKEVMEWLSPGNASARHDEFSLKRVPGSGRWVVESREFKDWVKASPQVLIGLGNGSVLSMYRELMTRGYWKIIHCVRVHLIGIVNVIVLASLTNSKLIRIVDSHLFISTTMKNPIQER
jgi:hypothetical protein